MSENRNSAQISAPMHNIIRLLRGIFDSQQANYIGAMCMVTCVAFFTIDIALDIIRISQGEFIFTSYDTTHFTLEIIAVLCLVYAFLNVVRRLQQARRQIDASRSKLESIRQDFREIFEGKCKAWSLTAAERDVAILLLKGLPLAEIAEARKTAIGTVKAQSSTIFRKASVRSRPELMSVILDDFLESSDR
ncbi:helix-turn-helix transcriptional regulator [Phreatobacter oligotrophus]|uniref:helix-turn-helix transcriptional regulator n=1 Tax=Phreatobacter oligotrophus TaxID=1122261 RepID=UPI000D3813D0|nr:helix-turn-helix transcriptional regulator [Phreatobacter oligotrophus]